MILEDAIQQDFTDYAAFVAQRRAVPDARDMFKYTARQILHAQYREKLDHKHPFKKSQKSVAAATAFSYVHGDASAYQQIIHMGRDLVQRYKFEEITGNGGTPMQSDGYAASRYTEARLSPLSADVFQYLEEGLNKNDWSPTYDEEGVFPLVLPSVGFYNICNGSFGSIGVGLISSVPQFNLDEVNKSIIALIRGNDIPNLLPDFSSGGILLNPTTTQRSLEKGEGKSILLRGKVSLNFKENYLDITELPYGVYTETICKEIGQHLEDGNCPITEFKDLSKKTVFIRVWGKHLKEIEDWLYKNTSVQKHFTVKLIMLKDGKKPKLFSLKEALEEHIKHARQVLRRHYEYEFEQLKIRQEVIDGLLMAYSILDNVIQTIKDSDGRQDAIELLTSTYDFTRRQAEAIVDLRLHRLSKIDISALQNELKNNLQLQDWLNLLLTDQAEFDNELVKYYEEVSRKYGDKRRTEIYKGDEFESGEDKTKPTKGFCFTWTREGYAADYINTTAFGAAPVDLEDTIYFITNELRGFKKAAKDLKLGEYQYSDIFKLNKDEVILFATTSKEMEEYDSIEYDGKTLHKSFINKSGPRGKILTNNKEKIKEIKWTT